MAHIAMIAMVAGSLLQAGGTLAAGDAALEEGKFAKDQYNRKGNEEVAAAQREAMQKDKQINLVQSRQRAVAAGSGLGALDPTILDLAGDTEQEGAYQKGMIMYGGHERADGLRTQGEAALRSGKAAQSASRWQAAATIASAAGSMYGKYGGSGPPASGGSAGAPMDLTSYTQYPMYG